MISFRTILFLFILCISGQLISAQSYRSKYKDQREPDSKVISSGFNYTFEKTSKTSFVFKRYFTINSQITHFVTYKDRYKRVKQGLSYHLYDDGTLVSMGSYVNNKKEGVWITNQYEKGSYVHDKRDGPWYITRPDSSLLEKRYYKEGILHGDLLSYDSLGQVKSVLVYENGELISPIDSIERTEEKPRFYGCEHLNLEQEELDLCAQNKMLEFIYGSLNYPRFERLNNVEGQVIITFIINKEGKMEDIEVLNGVSLNITSECLKVLKRMPDWQPGKQNGKLVTVKYTIPIKFKLEG